jgi:hypothetical protein
MVLQDRTATPARLRYTHAMIAPTLQPFDRSAGTDFKAFGRLTSRRSRLHRFDNSLTQVTGQRFRHRRSPHRRINADRFAQPNRLGNPPDSNRAEHALSHLNEILQGYGWRFGKGYRQRAVEAVRSYQTCNYLAACVMCGAAAESILLALSIAKRGDENGVLAEYRSSRGRATVRKSVLGGAPDAIGIPLGTALEVMSYWRDDAGHGVKTTISLSHADQSLTQLIRLAQLASEHWDKLTGVEPDAPK